MPTEHEQRLTTIDEMVSALKRTKAVSERMKRTAEEIREESEPED